MVRFVEFCIEIKNFGDIIDLVRDFCEYECEDWFRDIDFDEVRCGEDCCVAHDVLDYTIFMKDCIIKIRSEYKGLIHMKKYACFRVSGSYPCILNVVRIANKMKIKDFIISWR